MLFAAGSPPNRYGTTLRCYDNVQDIWHICWMQPYGGEFTQLTGKKVDDRVVQESISVDSHRRERWSFVNITANSFEWLGEVSHDNGVTWVIEQKMQAIRSTRL